MTRENPPRTERKAAGTEQRSEDLSVSPANIATCIRFWNKDSVGIGNTGGYNLIARLCSGSDGPWHVRAQIAWEIFQSISTMFYR